MTTLDQVLDAVMELPVEQRDILLDVVQHRRLEERRREIAKVAQESLAAFKVGELQPQPVTEIIKQLRCSLEEQASL